MSTNETPLDRALKSARSRRRCMIAGMVEEGAPQEVARRRYDENNEAGILLVELERYLQAENEARALIAELGTMTFERESVVVRLTSMLHKVIGHD